MSDLDLAELQHAYRVCCEQRDEAREAEINAAAIVADQAAQIAALLDLVRSLRAEMALGCCGYDEDVFARSNAAETCCRDLGLEI